MYLVYTFFWGLILQFLKFNLVLIYLFIFGFNVFSLHFFDLILQISLCSHLTLTILFVIRYHTLLLHLVFSEGYKVLGLKAIKGQGFYICSLLLGERDMEREECHITNMVVDKSKKLKVAKIDLNMKDIDGRLVISIEKL